MKNHTRLVAALATAFTALAFAPAASAQSLFWDTFGNSSDGGTGTWDTVTNNFNPTRTGNGGQRTTWNSDTALFNGTAGTVTIAAPGVSANALDFQVTGYTVGGAEALELTGAATVNVVAGSATLSAPVTGSLTKTGAGTLTLSGSRSGGGATIVSAGTLAVNTASLPSGNVTINGGTLALSSGGSYGLGSLTLGGGTIDFGSLGNAAVTFSGFTGSSVINVINYVYSATNFIRFSNITEAANTVLFTIDGGTASFNGAGELVLGAIPEPSSFAALAGLAVLGLVASRRRRSA